MDGDRESWDEHWRQCRGGNKDLSQDPTHRRYYQVVRNLLVRHNIDVSSMSLLELGCGRGTMSLAFAKIGASVQLLDSSGQALRIAMELFEKYHLPPPRIIAANALDSGLYDCTADVVVSVGLVEHFTDPLPLLTESLRLAGRLAAHIVIPKDRSNDAFYRNNLDTTWYEEQGWDSLWITDKAFLIHAAK